MTYPAREIILTDGGKIVLETPDGVTVRITRFDEKGFWKGNASGYDLRSAVRSLFEKRLGVLENSEAERVDELVRYIESTKGRVTA